MKRKKLLAALIVVVLVVAALVWWRSAGVASTRSEETISTEVVALGSIRQEVQCTGSVVSNRDVEIKCRASGPIVNLPHDVSDMVKKDDLLIELDPVDAQRMVAQSTATLAASQARLASAENNLLTAQATLESQKKKVAAALDSSRARAEDAAAKAKRQEELLAKKFSSPEEFETARTSAVQAEQDLRATEAQAEDLHTQELELESRRQDINLNKAQAESNRIALGLAQLQLSYTKVYAPIDGVISARTVQVGQIISSGVTNVGGGTSAMVISDLSRVFIVAAVDESSIGQVALGQTVTVTADAFPRQQFDGAVDRIGAKGVNLQNVITFEVRIEIVSENKTLLKPVMTANVTILTAERNDVLLIPATSIFREKRSTFVAVKNGSAKEEQRPVEIGITDGVNTEVLSGLQEGDMVVVRKPEEDSRWRADERRESGARNERMRGRMMMNTMGGGSGRSGGRR